MPNVNVGGVTVHCQVCPLLKGLRLKVGWVCLIYLILQRAMIVVFQIIDSGIVHFDRPPVVNFLTRHSSEVQEVIGTPALPTSTPGNVGASLRLSSITFRDNQIRNHLLSLPTRTVTPGGRGGHLSSRWYQRRRRRGRRRSGESGS